MEKTSVNNPKAQKALAIARNVILAADEATALAKALARKKRIFQPKNRSPKNKFERRLKIFRAIVNLGSIKRQNLMILVTPIPRYPKGWDSGNNLPEFVKVF